MKTVLTIAGSDPSGGAGVQADLKTFDALGCKGLSAITALTAQNNRRVYSTLVLPPSFLKKQVITLLEEFTVDAVKIGMTGSTANLNAIGWLIREKGLENVVLDTVLCSTGGYPLLDKKGVFAVKKLLPLVKIATPNIPEASALTGVDIRDTDGMEEAALALFSAGVPYVLIKGGHLEGAPVDILYDGKKFHRFKGKRIRGGREKFHGTGCKLSAAIAAGLARGLSVKKAVEDAKKYLNRILTGR
ncbi:MAG: bifunctional hydroxymethylpyrimidine kinase/phosphomethylpyrimidine kinase [Deltaproteobacteria bacterium]|nr:bifunctional hydroxymethylpyrimidine kinase/phosphomethylpyrimidine kinase [Deltaproteobacteria bacterium]